MKFLDVRTMVLDQVQVIKDENELTTSYYCWEHISIDLQFDIIDIELEVGEKVPNLQFDIT